LGGVCANSAQVAVVLDDDAAPLGGDKATRPNNSELVAMHIVIALRINPTVLIRLCLPDCFDCPAVVTHDTGWSLP
jgi:hypothetical protein